MKHPRLYGAAFAVAATTVLAGCGGDTPSANTSQAASAGASVANSAAAAATSAAASGSASGSASAAAATGSVTVANQSSDGSTMTVDMVMLSGVDKGWIAVHKDQDGAPGAVVGKTQVKSGSNNNVEVKFDSKQSTGKFWPMLHIDAGTAGTYEFPGPDAPVTQGGKPVMKQVTVTVK